MRPRNWIGMAALLLAALACNFSIPGSTTAPPIATSPVLAPADTAAPPSPAADTPAPISTNPPVIPAQPQEAILILEPGPGSKVISPLRIAGLADPTFEQTLVVNILLADGSLLAGGPVTIQADLGQRGPFSLDLPFSVGSDQPAFIQVYDVSARDGGLIHLAQVKVRLSPSGPASINPGLPHPEQIIIEQPANGDTIRGGLVLVSGFGLASFEQTLVIEVYDANGLLIGQEPIIVSAPEMGQPGPFSAQVSYSLSSGGPGRIVVRDPSVVFAGDNHLSSIEVRLEP